MLGVLGAIRGINRGLRVIKGFNGIKGIKDI